MDIEINYEDFLRFSIVLKGKFINVFENIRKNLKNDDDMNFMISALLGWENQNIYFLEDLLKKHYKTEKISYNHVEEELFNHYSYINLCHILPQYIVTFLNLSHNEISSPQRLKKIYFELREKWIDFLNKIDICNKEHFLYQIKSIIHREKEVIFADEYLK